MTIIRGKITTVYRDSFEDKPTIIPGIISDKDKKPALDDGVEAKYNTMLESESPGGGVTNMFKTPIEDRKLPEYECMYSSITRGVVTPVHKNDSMQESESPRGVVTSIFKSDGELPECDIEMEARFNARFGCKSWWTEPSK